MSTEMFTSLPSTEAAELTDIICAVQGYTNSSNLGLSVQESLQQIYDLFSANIIQSNAGNPNGQLAGTTYGLVWDTTNNLAWVCTATGTASTAVWKPIVGPLTNGQVLIGSTGNAPVAATIQAGNSNIVVTNGPGTITISGVASGTVNSGSVGDIAYYAANGASVSGFSASDNATFYTNSLGQLQSTASMVDGEILIGSTGSAPVLGTIVGQNGVTVTSGAGSIIVDGNGAGSGSVGDGDVGQLAYYSATGTAVDGLAANPSAIFCTDATGEVQSTVSLTDGELLIGNTGDAPTVATLTAGTNVTITNAPGAITISASGGISDVTIDTDLGGSVTGSTLTLTGGETGLVTNSSGTTITLEGLLSPSYGGTGSNAKPLDGEILVGNTDLEIYNVTTLTAGTNVTITNAPGEITISASGGDGISVIDCDTGSVTGSSITLVGGISGLLTVGNTNEISIEGVLVPEFGGTGVTSFPLPSTAVPVDGATIIEANGSASYTSVEDLATVTLQQAITPIFTLGSTAYFAVAGTAYVSVYSFDGTTAALVQQITDGNLTHLWTGVAQYEIGGTEYLVAVTQDPPLLYTYSWNGTAWVQVGTAVGNGTRFNSLSYFVIAGTSYVAMPDDAVNSFYLYSWGGSAWTRIATIAAQPVSQITNLVSLVIGGNQYLIALEGFYGFNSFVWNGTTFVQTQAFSLTTSSEARSGTSFFVGGVTYLVISDLGTNKLYVFNFNTMTLQWEAYQTISGPTSFNYGYGVSAYTVNDVVYVSASSTGLSGANAAPCYIKTFAWTGSALSLDDEVTVNNSLDRALNVSAYDSNYYLINGSLEATSNIFEFVPPITEIAVGLVPATKGGTGLSTTPTNGQLLIGNSSTSTYALSTLTAGSNITITNAPGAITIASTGGSGANYLTWSNTAVSVNPMVVSTGYIANNASRLTFTLPTTAAAGTVLAVAGLGAGGWTIAQNAGQNIIFSGSSTTTGTGGSLSSALQYDSLQLLCLVANTTWSVITSVGNITIVQELQFLTYNIHKEQ